MQHPPTSQQRTGRWTERSESPLGVYECVNVCIRGAMQCYIILLCQYSKVREKSRIKETKKKHKIPESQMKVNVKEQRQRLFVFVYYLSLNSVDIFNKMLIMH